MAPNSEVEFDDAKADDASVPSRKELPPEKLAEHKAIDLLSRREHTRAELETKLSKRDFSAEAIEIAIDILVARGWQSDERFAELFIEQRANRGKGPRMVRHELAKRGVSSSLAAIALENTEVDWQEIANSSIAKKFRVGDDYVKMRRFMEQRGFDASQARKAIQLLQQPEADGFSFEE